MKKKNFFATATLIGVMVGAGIFGLPYTIAKSGVIPGLFYFLFLGTAVMFLYLFVGEIVLRTKDNCRLVGHSRRYLGKGGRQLIVISTFVGLGGSLLVYTIIGSEFLKIISTTIFPTTVGIPQVYFGLVFVFGLSLFIFKGVKMIALIEALTNSFFFLIIFFVFCFGLSKINLQNFTLINTENLFLPFGIILFTLSGWSLVPEIGGILKTSDERKKLKKVIIVSVTSVIVISLLFVFMVVGVSGDNVSPDAISGLNSFFGPQILFFLVLAALITIADSFLILGLSFRNTLICDYEISPKISSLIACGVPLLLFLAGFRNFIGTVGFIGTIVGAIEGVLVVLIYKKAKKLFDREPEYSLQVPSLVFYVLIFTFVLGAFFQLFF
ncbi:aromatic amino acid transport family protein [Patescibacteria group bacterium]